MAQAEATRNRDSHLYGWHDDLRDGRKPSPPPYVPLDRFTMPASFAHPLPAAFLSIAALMITASAPAQDAKGAAGGASGTWLTEKGDARVKVTPCGEGICGRIIWLREPTDPQTGQPQLDDKNPNPALKTRPMIGLNLFNNMRTTGPANWAGNIYNPDDGHYYASKVTLLDASSLRVEGCVEAICGGETWSRIGR